MKALIKRWGLFLTINLLVLAVLGFIMQLIGIPSGDWINLLIYCAIFGFAGAIISLFASKAMAKSSYKITPLTRETATGKARYLYDTIEKMAAHKGIKMPEFGIYQSPDNNAFATGASKHKSLIAFSSGIMHNLDEDELAAVAGHEMTHVTEGDMVTTTLLMGTMNTFVLFLANVLAAVLSGRRGQRDESSGSSGIMNNAGQSAIAMILQNVLMILANIVLAAHSRHREFIADAGSAELTSPGHMITALEKISGAHVHTTRKDAFAIAKINSKQIMSLFATHPPIEKRIEALRKLMV
ncbi:MAG: protease HtpX [Candidatus Cloacimonetes bacterium]|jgi:heat shock protein HtpX|nr:protease HtpX [Candidatus Cloacimonadota bacterium]MDD4224049.1 protease HtpX [Candidatus Cloacimonadota bacterium]